MLQLSVNSDLQPGSGLAGGDASPIKVVLIRQISNSSPEAQSELYQVRKALGARIVAPAL